MEVESRRKFSLLVLLYLTYSAISVFELYNVFSLQIELHNAQYQIISDSATQFFRHLSVHHVVSNIFFLIAFTWVLFLYDESNMQISILIVLLASTMQLNILFDNVVGISGFVLSIVGFTFLRFTLKHPFSISPSDNPYMKIAILFLFIYAIHLLLLDVVFIAQSFANFQDLSVKVDFSIYGVKSSFVHILGFFIGVSISAILKFLGEPHDVNITGSVKN